MCSRLRAVGEQNTSWNARNYRVAGRTRAKQFVPRHCLAPHKSTHERRITDGSAGYTLYTICLAPVAPTGIGRGEEVRGRCRAIRPS